MLNTVRRSRYEEDDLIRYMVNENFQQDVRSEINNACQMVGLSCNSKQYQICTKSHL